MQNIQVNNKQNKDFAMSLKYNLDQEKSIAVNKKLHTTSTLDTNFLKTAGEKNPHLKCVYVPQILFNRI